MDTGGVVWLPDGGFGGGGGDYNVACQEAFGGNYYACGSEYYQEWYSTLVYCCPY